MNETAPAIPSRREFGFALAGLGAIASAPGVADEPKLPDLKDATASMETILRHRFGKILDEAQIKKVLAAVMRGRTTGEFLGRNKVTNADEPGFVFSADV